MQDKVDKVWAVMGREVFDSGDVRIWIIAIYPDAEMADQHAQEAERWHVDNYVSMTHRGQRQCKPRQNPFDPYSTDETDIQNYYISDSPIPFVLHVDQFLERFPT